MAVVVAVAAAEAEGDGVGVLADDELEGEEVEAVGEADGEVVPVDEVLGVELAEADGSAVGEVLVVGEGVTVSHCCPDVVAKVSARAGEAATVAKAKADAPVTRTPPAIRLVATGRTRVKHMEDVLPVLFVTYTERLITWSCYIYCQSTPYPYIRHHHRHRAPPMCG